MTYRNQMPKSFRDGEPTDFVVQELRAAGRVAINGMYDVDKDTLYDERYGVFRTRAHTTSGRKLKHPASQDSLNKLKAMVEEPSSETDRQRLDRLELSLLTELRTLSNKLGMLHTMSDGETSATVADMLRSLATQGQYLDKMAEARLARIEAKLDILVNKYGA